LAPFGYLLFGIWAILPEQETNIMKKHKLKNIISTLKKLRDEHHSQLDNSILAELDEVIRELEKFSSHKQSDVGLGTLSFRALQIMGCLIKLVSNLKDLMK
jgi:hypothetical protein